MRPAAKLPRRCHSHPHRRDLELVGRGAGCAVWTPASPKREGLRHKTSPSEQGATVPPGSESSLKQTLKNCGEDLRPAPGGHTTFHGKVVSGQTSRDAPVPVASGKGDALLDASLRWQVLTFWHWVGIQNCSSRQERGTGDVSGSEQGAMGRESWSPVRAATAELWVPSWGQEVGQTGPDRCGEADHQMGLVRVSHRVRWKARPKESNNHHQI